jgi:glycosyltransferase involved in cell wall biosynthesis
MKIPRIAYCSPVNPAASGISDYSEELLPYLGQYADITLYLEDGLQPDNLQLARHLEVQPLRRLERAHRRRPYDAIVYHMGNSPVHAEIWRAAQRLPGVIVLHEFVLHHFMLWYAANIQHDVQLYVRAMQARYGEKGAHIAQLMIRGRFTEATFQFPLCEPVVAAARGLLAHSRYVQARVNALQPELPTSVVPMGVPLPPAIPRAAARARLGIVPDALLLASFGHINAYKRLEPALRALLELHHERPEARYVLVGSMSPHYDVPGLIRRMGLEDVVTITGYVSRATFEDYVAAADICLNLRHPTAGETSASLLRLLGAGRPTLVSATGAFTELPPDVAAQVDPDAGESTLILAYCRLLAGCPAVAAALGTQARTYVAQEHTLERAAQGYARFLARLYRWELVRRIRPAPLWSLETATLADVTRAIRAATTPAATPAPPHPIPAVGRALAELGISERDTALLRSVAVRLAELEDGTEY